MEKTYNEKELKEKADQVFAEFPDAKKVFATLDGNVFLMENRARLHAGNKGRVIPFDRPIEETKKELKANDSTKETTSKPPKAEEQIAAIKAATTLDELKAFEADSRVTVKAALEARLKELQNPE